MFTLWHLSGAGGYFSTRVDYQRSLWSGKFLVHGYTTDFNHTFVLGQQVILEDTGLGNRPSLPFQSPDTKVS